MPPRKSLPAASTSTPRRAAAVAADSALDTSKSSKRGTKRKHGENGDDEGGEEKQVEGIDPEKELEAWQDFAAEHYEMVEQLPLELHRNFRLLKELDLGCVAQMEKLHALIRQYIKQRLSLVNLPNQPISEAMEVDPPPDELGAVEGTADDGAAQPETKFEEASESAKLKVAAPAGAEEAADHSEVEEDLIPVADGEGGIVAIPESAAEEPAPPRHPFPSVDAEVDPTGTDDTVEAAKNEEEGDDEANPAEGGVQEEKVLPWTMLPDIGKLSREIVRNAEEKVAVAVGAYNAIDRHIRALDSALSAQEASILLGLRPSTLPSSALDAHLHPDEIALQGSVEDGPVTIGMGGGGRRKNKKGRKSEVAPMAVMQAVAEIPGLEGIDAMEANADPNEPRYCLCNRVSFGVMIGCDNDDCPTEWFHLPCVGLLAEPTGKWLCPTCRPHGVGVAAAAASLGAGSDHVKLPPSVQKNKKAVPKGARRKR